MQHQMNEQELKAQLNLIESMIAQGRRTTEHWSWAFVLWGFAYMVAFAWSVWGHAPVWAWPVTMLAAGLLTWIIAARESRHQAETTLGRAVGSVWVAMGISMFVVFPALGFTGRLTDAHIFVAVAAAMLGLVNAALGMLLRWRAQFACGVLWWITCAAGCAVSENQAIVIFLIAIFLCNIVFGIYGMTRESRKGQAGGAVHA
jgi:hypothetical protein